MSQSNNPVVYNKQPGAAVSIVNHARNFVPTTTWVSRADPVEGVLPGLEYLTTVDTIAVKQTYVVPDVGSSPLANRNQYSIQNVQGEQLYTAVERSKYWQRECCGPQRGFTINVVDVTKKKVMTLRRPFKCCALSCLSCLAGISCFSEEFTIESPPGTVIGSVSQRPTCCFVQELHVKDETGKDIFTVQGPCECFLTPCSDEEYTIHQMNGHLVGTVVKKWDGFCSGLLPDAEAFRITFIMGLDSKMKAILLGTSFLIASSAFNTSASN